jgi:hypothetical protein
MGRAGDTVRKTSTKTATQDIIHSLHGPNCMTTPSKACKQCNILMQYSEEVLITLFLLGVRGAHMIQTRWMPRMHT